MVLTNAGRRRGSPLLTPFCDFSKDFCRCAFGSNMGWLRREVTKALGHNKSLQDIADAEAAAKRARDNFQDLGSQAMTMSKFGDQGLPVWVEEHHSLPVDAIVRVTGLSDKDGETMYTAVLNGDVDSLRPLLAKYATEPAEPEEPAAEPVPEAAKGKGKGKEPPAEPAPDAEAEAAPVPAAAEWELVDRYGWELPAVAAACGHLEALELVLDAGCSANAQNAYSGRSALHRVANAGQVALLEMLLAKGGSVDMAAKDSATPLHIAAGHGHLDVVRALLEAGATVDLRDVCEQTPLLAAAEAGHTPVVEALLDAGAALEACDENGWTPLHHACMGAEGKEVAAFGALAALLVSRGADPERKTRGERTCRRMQPSLFEAGGAVHTALQALAEAKAKEEAEAAAAAEGAGE